MGKRKEKEKVIREFSAGGVIFKENGKYWLVTQSAPSKEYPEAVWRLPKGNIDEGETAEQAALREVREEGGVVAKIGKKIETTKYFFTTHEGEKILKFVTFYLMEWQEDLKEGFGEETSEIAWLPYEEAFKTLKYKGEKEMLKKAQALFEEGIQASLV